MQQGRAPCETAALTSFHITFQCARVRQHQVKRRSRSLILIGLSASGVGRDVLLVLKQGRRRLYFNHCSPMTVGYFHTHFIFSLQVTPDLFFHD